MRYDGVEVETRPGDTLAAALLRAYTPDLVFGTWGAVLLWCAVKWPDVEQPITDART